MDLVKNVIESSLFQHSRFAEGQSGKLAAIWFRVDPKEFDDSDISIPYRYVLRSRMIQIKAYYRLSPANLVLKYGFLHFRYPSFWCKGARVRSLALPTIMYREKE